MKSRFLLFVLSLGLLLWPAGPGQTAPASWTADDKLLAAYYFYWYNVYTGQHFLNPDGTDALTDHPPDAYLPDYSWTEVAWHRRELVDMMAAGIDVVLPVYWGSSQEAYWSTPGLQKLVQAEQALIAEGASPPKIGMFYDTTALEQQNGNVPPDLTTTAGKALFYGMMADFFDLIPAGLWATIEGRPIVFLYIASYASAFDQSTFAYVDQQFQVDYGTTPYVVRETSWQGVDTDGAYQWGVALNGPVAQGRVASLGPGYDESAVWNRPDPRVRDRECGQFYQDGWEQVITSGATLVALETWNEWHEGTDIAPSREYGTAYVSLTASNAARWRATDLGAAALVWLDLGAKPRLEGLRPAFNFADGAWLTGWRAGREGAYADLSSTPPSYYIYLDVNDDFLHATPAEVWVTVEYFDGDGARWFLEYDAVDAPYAMTDPIAPQNSGEWKRETFHLTDAFFGGRQNVGADLRLSNMSWEAGEANYFGRVWIAKAAPSNRAPDLARPRVVCLRPGDVVDVTIVATDPDGDTPALELEQDAPFATLTDNGRGFGTLHLAPAQADLRPCPYTLRIVATDQGSPPLADAVTVEVLLAGECVFLPLARR